MKTFIVFLAFAIVFSGFMIFTEDSNNYVRLQKYLKSLSEECAAGGALMIDYETSLAQHKYTINKIDAVKLAEFISANFNASIYPLNHGKVTVEDIERFKNDAGNECIRVVSNWEADSDYRLMRLSFINSPDIVTQAAVYEVVE